MCCRWRLSLGPLTGIRVPAPSANLSNTSRHFYADDAVIYSTAVHTAGTRRSLCVCVCTNQLPGSFNMADHCARSPTHHWKLEAAAKEASINGQRQHHPTALTNRPFLIGSCLLVPGSPESWKLFRLMIESHFASVCSSCSA